VKKSVKNASYTRHLKNLTLGVSLILAVFIQAEAQEQNSGLFLEPAVTYELGDSHVNYPSPLSSSTGSQEGFGIGARVGVHMYEAFFLGVDGRYSMPKFKDSTASYDASAVSTNWGPVIGMQMPDIGLRLWGSYILGGTLNPDQSGNLDVKFSDATGYRIGAGFRVMAFSLNLEYQKLDYDKTKLEQLGPFATSTALNNVQLENEAWIVSASFPMELF